MKNTIAVSILLAASLMMTGEVRAQCDELGEGTLCLVSHAPTFYVAPQLEFLYYVSPAFEISHSDDSKHAWINVVAPIELHITDGETSMTIQLGQKPSDLAEKLAETERNLDHARSTAKHQWDRIKSLKIELEEAERYYRELETSEQRIERLHRSMMIRQGD